MHETHNAFKQPAHRTPAELSRLKAEKDRREFEEQQLRRKQQEEEIIRKRQMELRQQQQQQVRLYYLLRIYLVMLTLFRLDAVRSTCLSSPRSRA